MIFYHADTHGLLKAGQFLELYRAKTPICDLYQSGTSSFGERAFMRPFDPAQRTMQIIDIVFDYVRLARFADKPSRYPLFSHLYVLKIVKDGLKKLKRVSPKKQMAAPCIALLAFRFTRSNVTMPTLQTLAF